MTKKEIKQGLKNNGVKGWSRALITDANWVMVGDYTGKIENNVLHLQPTNLKDKKSRCYVIEFRG